MKFGQSPCTIVQGLWPDFGATLKIRKKSNFDRNQLKLSTHHKYMYMYQKVLKCLLFVCVNESVSVCVSVSSEPTEEERRLQRKDERNKSRMKIYDLDWTLVTG